jgi:hypothetical protein
LHETQAQFLLDNYKPTFFDKLFSQQSKKTRKFQQQIIAGVAKDKQIFANEIEKHESDKSEWEIMHHIAQGIINHNANIYKTAVEKLIPFNSIPVGKRISFNFQPFYKSLMYL